METRQYHEASSLYPLMAGSDFEKLKKDIATNCLREAIWLHPDGSIIDGRNRYRACIETNTKPRFRTWNGKGSLITLIVSMNDHRRHLTSSQRAAISLNVGRALSEEIAKEKAEKNRLLALKREAEQRQEKLDPVTENQVLEIIQKPARDAALETAQLIHTNPHYISDAKKLQKEAPDLLEKVKLGNKTVPVAMKELRSRQLGIERSRLAQSALDILPNDRWTVEVADIRTYQTDKQFDFIITDPPYPCEYLDLYGILAERSSEWLKPTGLLIAMAGQSYLNQIVQLMDKHLNYYWTGCYLTPGQPTPLRHKQVNTTWKPILVYSLQDYKGKIFGDVWKSKRNEKEYHKWGQSVSGMLSLVKQICLPGQSIFDPFCGAGATGTAALMHGCLFHGIDKDEQSVNITKARLGGFNDEAKT